MNTVHRFCSVKYTEKITVYTAVMDSNDEMFLTQTTFKDSSSGEDTDGVIS